MVTHPTQPSTCSGCPLFGVAKGFVLGVGSPEKAKFVVILEAPDSQDIQFTLNPNAKRFMFSTQAECDTEIAQRKKDFPELTNGSIRTGVPATGRAGLALDAWIMRKVGLRREDAFIDHMIRCLPPKGKTNNYPVGEIKKAAELHCRRYDRLAAFRPDTIVLSISPASLVTEITPLPLAIKDFEKVRDFTNQGRKVLTLLGGKTTQAFARYGANIGRWRGHYAALPEDWSETYKQAFVYQGKQRKSKKVIERPVELTESCKSCKRYKGKNAPKNACRACWERYERCSSLVNSAG